MTEINKEIMKKLVKRTYIIPWKFLFQTWGSRTTNLKAMGIILHKYSKGVMNPKENELRYHEHDTNGRKPNEEEGVGSVNPLLRTLEKRLAIVIVKSLTFWECSPNLMKTKNKVVLQQMLENQKMLSPKDTDWVLRIRSKPHAYKRTVLTYKIWYSKIN